MRSILQLRTPQNGDGDQHQFGGLNVTEAAAPPQAQPAKVRFREPQIEMAHGAGGKASRRLVEGLFAPLLFASPSEPLGDAAHLDFGRTKDRHHYRQLRRQPLSFPAAPSENLQ